MTMRIMTTTTMTTIMGATDIPTITGAATITGMDMGIIMRRSTWAAPLPLAWV